MADDGIVLDAASKVSQFFGRNIEEPIEGYTEIASTKKQGGKMVKAVIQAFNAKNNKSIRFGTVCGHAVDGTLIARQIQRKNRENAQNLKQTALNGALPTMTDMANGFLKMAVEDFEDGHVEFVGIPVWEKEDIAQALPMHDEQSTYLERLVFFDENQGFGYLKVRDEHTKKQFEPDEFSIDRVVFPDGIFESYLTAKKNHMRGHFTDGTGISVLPGHKQIAALIQAYEQGFSGKLRPDEYLKFMGVYNVKFIQPVLPDNTIKISVKDSYAGFWGMFLGNASIFIGKDKVCMMESETFTVEKGEEPKTITPDRLIEAAAQTLGCLYLNQKNPENVIPVFQGFEIAEFEDIEIAPGQTVEIEAKLREQNDNGFTGDVNIWVNDKKAVVIEQIQCGLMDKERLKEFFRRLREKRKRQGLKKEEEEK